MLFIPPPGRYPHRMRPSFLCLAALLILPHAPAQAKPPREESPAPRDVLEDFGKSNSDAELAKAIAAAGAHPLGTLQNPIRVAGPEGVRAYLDRLRCEDGAQPKIGAGAPGDVDSYGSVTTVHLLDCGGVSRTLVFDIYHQEHVETGAPSGFRFDR